MITARPVDPSGWMRLAYADTLRQGRLTPQGLKALSTSYTMAAYAARNTSIARGRRGGTRHLDSDLAAAERGAVELLGRERGVLGQREVHVAEAARLARRAVAHDEGAPRRHELGEVRRELLARRGEGQAAHEHGRHIRRRRR